jgi:hypothetical protein
MDTSPLVVLEAKVGTEGNGCRLLAMHRTGISPPMDLDADEDAVLGADTSSCWGCQG